MGSLTASAQEKHFTEMDVESSNVHLVALLLVRYKNQYCLPISAEGIILVVHRVERPTSAPSAVCELDHSWRVNVALLPVTNKIRSQNDLVEDREMLDHMRVGGEV